MFRFSVVLVIYLIGQTSSPEPARFGSAGRTLADAEVAEIVAIANLAGTRPWLVLGLPSTISGVATVTVYLQPDLKGAQVSRGRVLNLVADDPPVVSRRSVWRVKDTGSYAYIVPSGGRPFEISDERDVGWPFAVDGEIDDDTLLSLVAFIRSRPRIPNVPEGQAPRQLSAAPIAVAARRGDQFIVALRTGDATGQRVTVTRNNRRWTITNFESWIV